MNYSLEAEEAVLGSCLIDPEAIFQITLKPSDFYRDKNQWVFGAFLSLADKSEGQKLDAIGGSAYLSHLVANCATSVHIRHYAGIVKKHSLQRELFTAAMKIEEIATRGGSVAEAINALMGIRDDSDHVLTPKDMANLADTRYPALIGQPSGIYWSLPFLDELGCLQRGQLCVIAGVTGHGKTTLAHQIARTNKTLYVSIEMSPEDLLDREIARLSHRHIDQISRGSYSETVYDDIIKAQGRLAETDIHYFSRGNIGVDTVYAHARRLTGLELVVVDYLQLMKWPKEAKTKMQAVADNIVNLKTHVARELDVPVIVISQLSRDVNAPLNYRLKESGEIENTADWIFYVQQVKDGEEKHTKILFGKRRQGGIPKVTEWPVEFDPIKQEYKGV